MLLLDRRTLLAGAAAGAAMDAKAFAASAVASPPGFERFPIWPGRPPGGERVTVREEETLRGPDDAIFTHVTTPTLAILRPEAVGAKPNGAAIMLIPGGGYLRVAVGKEGYAVARRLARAGYVCFVLLYRLPADGWAAGPEAPLQDAQRALRIARGLAKKERFDADRMAVVGFSAGGHLAAWLTTRATESYAPVDAADREPLHAAVSAYLYPVIQMQGPHVHLGSRTELLGSSPSEEQMRRYSMDEGIQVDTPAFLAHALDDETVPPENSLAMTAALRARGTPVECHLFEDGGHGFGVGSQARSALAWPDLFIAFANRHGV